MFRKIQNISSTIIWWFFAAKIDYYNENLLFYSAFVKFTKPTYLVMKKKLRSDQQQQYKIILCINPAASAKTFLIPAWPFS